MYVLHVQMLCVYGEMRLNFTLIVGHQINDNLHSVAYTRHRPQLNKDWMLNSPGIQVKPETGGCYHGKADVLPRTGQVPYHNRARGAVSVYTARDQLLSHSRDGE